MSADPEGSGKRQQSQGRRRCTGVGTGGRTQRGESGGENKPWHAPLGSSSGHSASWKLTPCPTLSGLHQAPPSPGQRTLPDDEGQVGLDWTHPGGPEPAARGALSPPSEPLCPARADSGPSTRTHPHPPPPAWGLPSASPDTTALDAHPVLGRLGSRPRAATLPQVQVRTWWGWGCVCVCVCVRARQGMGPERVGVTLWGGGHRRLRMRGGPEKALISVAGTGALTLIPSG